MCVSSPRLWNIDSTSARVGLCEASRIRYTTDSLPLTGKPQSRGYKAHYTQAETRLIHPTHNVLFLTSVSLNTSYARWLCNVLRRAVTMWDAVLITQMYHYADELRDVFTEIQPNVALLFFSKRDLVQILRKQIKSLDWFYESVTQRGPLEKKRVVKRAEYRNRCCSTRCMIGTFKGNQFSLRLLGRIL